MPKAKIEQGSRIVYYAEGAPYSGPFPALVEAVHPLVKGESLPDVDLKVYFNGLDGKAHVKTRVKHALEPQKHCWGEVPLDWPWPEPKVDEVASGAPAVTDAPTK